MNKVKNKLSLAFICVCMIIFSQAFVCFAADGTLQFSDPSGKVGEEITVTVKMDAGGAAIGDGDVTVSYDSSKLEFVRGTNASGGAGTVTLSASGTGTETELNYDMVFKALAEGTSTIEVTSSTAYLFSDETLNLQNGAATVTVGAGDGTAAAAAPAAGDGGIDISGTSYSIYNDFTDALIPDGFSKTVVSCNGADYNGVQQDVSGRKFLFVMQNGSETPLMALDDENGGFILADQVALSENQYIYILGNGNDSKLPKEFGETTLNLNGTTFPIWQDSKNKEFYLVNALGPSGEIGFYQYDSVDGTYQRYVARDTTTAEDESQTGNKMFNNVKSVIDKNLLVVIAVTAVVFFILVLIVIILAVVIGKKNRELDELYEEYDEGDMIPKNKKNSREQFIGSDNSDYEDESDDYMEEDVEY